jgi:NAD-dependent dihydropyrimidine dehydrogenase PreA subunit
MAEVENNRKRIPVIDYNKCTGRGICVEVCPEDIFEIRNLDQIEFCEETKTAGLCPEPHYAAKGKRSYPVNIDNCTECEICIEKCPEQAIKLVTKN